MGDEKIYSFAVKRILLTINTYFISYFIVRDEEIMKAIKKGDSFSP